MAVFGGGGGAQNIEAKVTLETGEARRSASLLGRAVAEFTQSARQEFKDTEAEADKFAGSLKAAGAAASGASGGFSNFQKTLITLQSGLAVGRAALAGLSQAFDALQRGSELEGVARAFETLQAASGALAGDTLPRLRASTQGLVSDFDLIKRANLAAQLGISAKGFDTLAGAAVRLGRAVGRDAIQSIDDLTVGVGRQSKLILDNLGILYSADDAYQKFAAANGKLASDLTDSERHLAGQARIFELIREKAAGLPQPVGDAGSAATRAAASFQNLTDEFLRGANSGPQLAGFLDEFGRGLDVLAGKARGAGAAVADVVGGFLTFDPVGKFNQLFGDSPAPAKAAADPEKKLLDSLFGTQEAVEAESKRRAARTAAAITADQKRVTEAQGQLAGAAEKARAGFTQALDIVDVPDATAAKVAEAQKGFERIFQAVGKGGKSLAAAREESVAYAKSISGNAAQLTAFSAVGVRAFKKVQDETQKAERAADSLAKKGFSMAAAEAKRLDDEMSRFKLSVVDALNLGPVSEFATLIEKAFTEPDPGRLAAAITDIAAAAQKANVPLAKLDQEFRRQLATRIEIDKLVQGDEPLGPGNYAGAIEAQQQKESNAGSVFGIKFESLSQDTAAAIESGLQTGFSTLGQALTSGLDRADVPGIAAGIGSAIGAAFGSPQAGAAVGGLFGQLIGPLTKEANKSTLSRIVASAIFGPLVLVGQADTAATTARKNVDRMFADIFDANRLSIIVGGQVKRINDLVFSGDTLFGGAVKVGPTEGPFHALLDGLPAEAQAAFQGVGTAFEGFAGVADDLSGFVGAAIANNIGGNLNNLQLLVQSTGKSFEDLGDKIITAFENGGLTIDQAADRLRGLQDLFTPGIPGAVGDVDQAFQNFQATLADNKGSRAFLDSLRDIEAEARERGVSTFAALQNTLVESGKFTQGSVAALFQAMVANGITSLEQLRDASSATLIQVGQDAKRVADGLAPIGGGGVTDPTKKPDYTPPTNFASGGFSGAAGSGGGRSAGQSAAEKAAADAKRQQEQLRGEVYKTLTASKQYAAVIDQIAARQVTGVQAGKEVKKLYVEITSATKTLAKAETDYQKALESGAAPKRLGQLAAALDKAQKASDAFAKAAKEATKDTFSLAGVVPFIKDLNELGIVSGVAGVSLDNTTKILVDGFKRGRLSIAEVNKLLDQSKDLLGQGIPNAVGAVSTAFANLVRGGRTGGQFSIDALKDVIVETEERFKSLGSTVRQQKLGELTGDFDKARAAKQDALARGASGTELKGFDDDLTRAKKLLDDFNSVSPKAGFEDLRAYLKENNPADQVDVFFKGLAENGINSFDAVKSASDESVTAILGTLDKLGFKFGDTAADVSGITKSLDDATVKANGGKDTLGDSLKLLQDYLAGATSLAPSLQLAQGPIAALASDFDTLLNRVAQLTGSEQTVNVVLNVRTNADTAQTQAVLDIVGGGTDGAVVSNSTGTGTPKQAARLKFLRNHGRGKSDEARRLQQALGA